MPRSTLPASATGVKAGGPHQPITATSKPRNGSIRQHQHNSPSTAAALQSITVARPTSRNCFGWTITQPFNCHGFTFSDGTSVRCRCELDFIQHRRLRTINAAGVATGCEGWRCQSNITATSTTNVSISGTAQLTVNTRLHAAVDQPFAPTSR